MFTTGANHNKCKPLVTLKIRKARLDSKDLETSKKEPSQFGNNIWTGETWKMNLYQNDGNRKLYSWRETIHDLKHTTSVKHVRGSAMACACMAAIGTETLVFHDDLTAGRSSRMNCEVCRAVLSA